MRVGPARPLMLGATLAVALVSAVACGGTAPTNASNPNTNGTGGTGGTQLPGIAECKLPTTGSGRGVYLGFPRRPNGLKTIGTVNVGVAMVDFPDAVATKTAQAAFNMISPGAVDFFAAASYGQMNLVLTPTLRWDRMSKASTGYGMTRATITFASQKAYATEALTLASRTLDFSNADAFVVLTNPDASVIDLGPTFTPDPGSGITISGRTMESGVTSGYDLNFWGPHWLNHEMGHATGLVDLIDFNPGTLNRDHWTGTFSIMTEINALAPMYFAWEAWQSGWIADAQITCAPAATTTTVTLTPIEDAGGMKAVIIPTGKYSAIVVESRRAKGLDYQLTRGGPLVYLVNTDIGSQNPNGLGLIKVLPLDDADYTKVSKLLSPDQSVTYAGVTVKFQSLTGGNDVIAVTRP
ncbi:hypothetical protein EBR44_07385 [bacterium]|jgi:M6 family metalloprotease-like protein|nr:hypothetical protein [bacterium]